MAITGNLSDFTLAEIFQFLTEGQKTGLLTLSYHNSAHHQPQNFYIWLRQGRIMAAANDLNNNGLIYLMDKRGWLSQKAAWKIAQVYPQNIPFGLHLKTQGVLQAEQLKLLFYVQVMQKICTFFKTPDACFEFNTQASLPMLEMTGLSTNGAEVILAGLRILKDWTYLADKLPESTSILTTTSDGDTHLPLNQLERQVWQFANQMVTIQEIAQKTNLELQQVQKIAFSLIMVGLVKEIPIVVVVPTHVETNEQLSPSFSPEKQQLSCSFFDNLLGFLRSKSNSSIPTNNRVKVDSIS